MRTILLVLCALTLFAGLTPKTAAQTVTTTLGAPPLDLDWLWSDEYQCWLWNGPQFQGDYEGHSFFKEYFLNHQFFNFFENTPAIRWAPIPNIQLNAIASQSGKPEHGTSPNNRTGKHDLGIVLLYAFECPPHCSCGLAKVSDDCRFFLNKTTDHK